MTFIAAGLERVVQAELYQYNPYFPGSQSVVCDFSELPPFPAE
jgi:hypothetical protein